MIPINEKKYTRVDRNGRDTSANFKLPAGCKVELQIVAVYYEVIRCSVCGEEIVVDGQGYRHECKEEVK